MAKPPERRRISLWEHLTSQNRDSSTPLGSQNDETGSVLPRRFSLRQTARCATIQSALAQLETAQAVNCLAGMRNAANRVRPDFYGI